MAASQAQGILPYRFKDISLLRRALTAGDSNKAIGPEREGNRSMAQLGDSLISCIVMSQGFDENVSRESSQNTLSRVRSKEWCTSVARSLHLDRFIQISHYQKYIGPQPRTLKNALAAIIGAVFVDSNRDFATLAKFMKDLRSGYESKLSATPDTPATPLSPTFTERDEQFDLASLPRGPATSSKGPGEPVSPYTADQDPAPSILPPEPVSSSLTHMLSHTNAQFGPVEPSRAPEPLEVAQAVHQRRVRPHEESESTESSSLIAEKQTQVEPPSKKRKRNAPPPPNKAMRAVFDEYQSRQQKKPDVGRWNFQVPPDTLTSFREYEEAFLPIETKHHRSLASLVAGIGDFTAILQVKYALASLRSHSVEGASRIAQKMDYAKRVRIIGSLGNNIQHFKLAQRLHTYQLYAELSDGAHVPDADGFIMESRPDLHVVAGRRGNPIHLQKSTIAKKMAGLNGTSSIAATGKRPSKRELSGLAVIGKRLNAIVHRWGVGVLALLGEWFTNDHLRNLTNSDFDELMTIVDRLEGEMIRTLSRAAEPAIRYFLDDGPDPLKLNLELVNVEVIHGLHRLSGDIEQLLSVASQLPEISEITQ